MLDCVYLLDQNIHWISFYVMSKKEYWFFLKTPFKIKPAICVFNKTAARPTIN